MKKIIVPFTSVSADPEIQRMRDMLTSGENLVIDDDGTIGRAGDPRFENSVNGTKAKTVPKAIVSASENGSSVRDLINEMRGEAEEADESDATGETHEKASPKKTGIVPKGIVSTRSVSDLINEMRGEGGPEGSDDEDNSGEESSKAATNYKLVPKAVVSVDMGGEMYGSVV